ncbi:MAG: hypothetical protein ABSG84_01345 [Acidobacteriaceae bacterium]|jgi:hypothetical protein
MTNPEPDNGKTRDELLQRIELMECMIAEGRQTTMRNGWIFVLWGLVDLAGVGWQQLPHHTEWVWPVCIVVGLALQFTIFALRKRAPRAARGTQCRSVQAVWGMMGLAMLVYVGTVLFTHFGWQYSYLSALLMIIGLAHAISAVILRWRVQAVVAGLWWAGAVAVLICNSYRAVNWIFLIEMCFGMIAFGLYVMFLEGQSTEGLKGGCV